MNATEILSIREILDKSIGKTFNFLASKEQLIEVYGYGVVFPITKGESVILKEYRYTEKKDKFMILVEGIERKPLWVPTSFININLKPNDKV